MYLLCFDGVEQSVEISRLDGKSISTNRFTEKDVFNLCNGKILSCEDKPHRFKWKLYWSLKEAMETIDDFINNKYSETYKDLFIREHV